MSTLRSARTLTLGFTLLLAGTVAPLGASSAAAASNCNPRTASHWTTVKSYTDVANFQAATRGSSSGTKVTDAKKFNENLRRVADETVAAVPYGTEILLKVVGMADASGDPASNKRLAAARAKSTYSALKRVMHPTDVGRIHAELIGVVSESTGPEARNASVTVLRCKETPAAPKNAYDRSSQGREASCDQTKVLTSLFEESWTFKIASPSYRDGLKPQDPDMFTSRSVYVAGVVASKLSSPGGVYIEVTGYSTPTGSTTSNDRLAADRAKTTVNALKKTLAANSGVDASRLTIRTVGSRVRVTTPRVKVAVSYCP